MKTYVWFRSSNPVAVARCRELFNKAHGGNLSPVRQRIDMETGEPIEPAMYGFPIGAGSDAGMNVGAAVFEVLRSGAIVGPRERLTESERFELLAFVAAEEDLEADWWYNPEHVNV